MSILTLQNLIIDRCRELQLGRSELVRRCGYKNVSKGIRRLEQVYAGELEIGRTLIRGLPSALELSPEVVHKAPDETLQRLEERASHAAAEAEVAWRAAFKPHACLLGTDTRPSQLLFFAITSGAERWLKIPLDLSQPSLTYAKQALAIVRRTPFVQYFGRTTGFIVNYTPDHAVRFDLEGEPVESFPRSP